MRGGRPSEETLYRWRRHCASELRSDTSSLDKGKKEKGLGCWAVAREQEEQEEGRQEEEEVREGSKEEVWRR